MVVALFAWTGPYHTYARQTLDKWASLTEHAIWTRRPPRGRSAYLSWCGVCTPRLRPDFALNWAAVREQRNAQGKGRRMQPSKRWAELAKCWGWQWLEGGDWLITNGQCVRPGWTGLGWIRHLAEEAWRQWMWNRDTKTEYIGLSVAPVQHFLKHAAEIGEGYRNRVMVGAAVDGRMLAERGVSFQCECGLEAPSRHRLTFTCPFLACMREAAQWSSESYFGWLQLPRQSSGMKSTSTATSWMP